MRAILAAILLPAVLALSIPSAHLDQEWEMWKSKYNRGYKSAGHEAFRRGAWEATYEKVKNHNLLADQGNKTYRLALNHFADMTPDELNSRGCLLPLHRDEKPVEVEKQRVGIDIPKEVDWRKENCVTPAKDQGICGSCWAFATVAVLESRYCIKHKQLFNMSEQQLVDCDNSKDQGCCGGLPRYAFEYVSNHGIMKSDDYKYVQHAAQCEFDDANAINMKLSKYYVLPEEVNMAAAVAFDGPLAVGFGVTMEFAFHDGKAIYDGPCAPEPNHAITIVGYGIEDDKDYWIIKNSWGEEWGDNGFGKILRNADQCNIAVETAAADVAGPEEFAMYQS